MPYDVVIGRDESDKKLFGKKGLVYLGKSYVTMGNYTSLSNPILVDIARSHVILVAGKRGCLDGDTMIFTDLGFKLIKNFNEKKDKVYSFNKESKKFEWEKAKLLRYPIMKEKLIKLIFLDGSEIVLTREHPLLCSYGKYEFWRRACDLKISDKIVSPTYVPEIMKKEESLRIARLLGFILADGTINIRKGRFKDGRGYLYNGTKARIRIFNQNDDVLNQAKKDFEKEFDVNVKRYKRNDCNCEVVETKYQKIVNKFVKLGVPIGYKSKIIRIPEIVFKSSNEFKSNFINALFCCDGYVPKTGRYLDYSSASKGFVYDLKLLLKHFNIESSVRKKISKLNGKSFLSYRLFITDRFSVNNFIKKIGLIHRIKKERLNSRSLQYIERKRKTYYLSDKLVGKKISKIEEVSNVKEVYDLTVDKNHSFIANGIISHNSGKSYTLGAIAEALCSLPREEAQNISPLIFDTMGIFWTMKFKNQKDKVLLEEWGLEPKNVPVKIFAPFGYFQDYKDAGIPVDKEFSIKISELGADDWITTFNLNFTDSVGVLVESVISELKEGHRSGRSLSDSEIENNPPTHPKLAESESSSARKKKGYDFNNIREVINGKEEFSQDVKNAATALFDAAETWKVFDEKKGTAVRDLIAPGQSTIIDLSMYASIGSFNVRGLIIGLVCKKLFAERMSARRSEEIQAVQHGIDYLYFKPQREMPLVWIFIDEAHEFLPAEGKTPATDALIQLLREGRQPGISMVMATQQPGKIHTDAMTQSDIVLSHRVTSEQDLKALNQIMQSYVYEGIKGKMDALPKLKGSAIVLDDNSERIYPMRVRPRFTWHGGEAPTAVRVEEGGRV